MSFQIVQLSPQQPVEVTSDNNVNSLIENEHESNSINVKEFCVISRIFIFVIFVDTIVTGGLFRNGRFCEQPDAEVKVK